MLVFLSNTRFCCFLSPCNLSLHRPYRLAYDFLVLQLLFAVLSSPPLSPRAASNDQCVGTLSATIGQPSKPHEIYQSFFFLYNCSVSFRILGFRDHFFLNLVPRILLLSSSLCQRLISSHKAELHSLWSSITLESVCESKDLDIARSTRWPLSIFSAPGVIQEKIISETFIDAKELLNGTDTPRRCNKLVVHRRTW